MLVHHPEPARRDHLFFWRVSSFGVRWVLCLILWKIVLLHHTYNISPYYLCNLLLLPAVRACDARVIAVGERTRRERACSSQVTCSSCFLFSSRSSLSFWMRVAKFLNLALSPLLGAMVDDSAISRSSLWHSSSSKVNKRKNTPRVMCSAGGQTYCILDLKKLFLWACYDVHGR